MNEIILIKVTDPHSTALRTGAVETRKSYTEESQKSFKKAVT